MLAASSSSWGNSRYHFPCGYHAGCLFLFMGQYQLPLSLWISFWITLPLHGAIPGTTSPVDIMLDNSSSSWGYIRYGINSIRGNAIADSLDNVKSQDFSI
jgi:hypothetical protein